METDYEIIDNGESDIIFNNEPESNITHTTEGKCIINLDEADSPMCTTPIDNEAEAEKDKEPTTCQLSMYFTPRKIAYPETQNEVEKPTPADCKRVVMSLSNKQKLDFLTTNLQESIKKIVNDSGSVDAPATLTLFERMTEELDSHYEQYYGKYRDIPVITNHFQNSLPVYSLVDIIKSINPNIRLSQQVIKQLNHEIINAKNKFDFVNHYFDNDYFYMSLNIEPEYLQIKHYFNLYNFIADWLVRNPSFVVLI